MTVNPARWDMSSTEKGSEETPMRAKDDQFVVNDRTMVCHRAFCQSAKLIGQGWRVADSVRTARDEGFNQCSNCKPFVFLVGDTDLMLLHMGDCRFARTKMSRLFDTVEAAYRSGFESRGGCCNPPGINEYLNRLESKLEQEEEEEEM